MQPDFWRAKWKAQQIGFHRSDVHPRLIRNAPWDEGARILVPLAGKSVDMAWLRERGHQVVGIELVEDALVAFFEENGIDYERREDGVLVSDRIELHAKNVFDVGAATIGTFTGVYDRAALVAIAPKDRERYVGLLAELLEPGGTLLLTSLDYDQAKMSGPPHAVPDDEVRRLFADFSSIERLERDAVIEQEPHFKKKGLDWLDEIVWRIVR